MNDDAQVLAGTVSILLLILLFGLWGIMLSIKNSNASKTKTRSCYTLRQTFSGIIWALFIYSFFLLRALWNIVFTPGHRLALAFLYSILLVPAGLALLLYVLWNRKWKVTVDNNIVTVSGFLRDTISVSMEDDSVCLKVLDGNFRGIKTSWKNYSLCQPKLLPEPSTVTTDLWMYSLPTIVRLTRL